MPAKIPPHMIFYSLYGQRPINYGHLRRGAFVEAEMKTGILPAGKNVR